MRLERVWILHTSEHVTLYTEYYGIDGRQGVQWGGDTCKQKKVIYQNIFLLATGSLKKLFNLFSVESTSVGAVGSEGGGAGQKSGEHRLCWIH